MKTLKFRQLIAPLGLSIILCTATLSAISQVQTAGPGPGHSLHGEAFNEGPRQGAHLMKGMSNVHFPVSTKSKLAQKFFDQGVSQLHGFWYFESERSFRQVNKIDSNCAMAYWGMAMSNTNNESRAKEFITKAVEKRASATEREQMYIDSLALFYNVDGKESDKKKRHIAKIAKITEICRKYPDDIEAKAFDAVEIWENQGLSKMWSHGGMEFLLNTILAVNPMHPVHHYRIHLWDGGKAAKALNSAAKCGQSSVGIAHMWHMPGHIYSDLQRYVDACWQQEAGVRVDNAQLIRNRVLPDQIHNYAHNSEWLVRDLSNVGRVHDAVTLAKNMIEMPRHPKYNTIERGSSTSGYGRLRLFEVLTRYEMWDEMIALCNSIYLEPGPNATEKGKRLTGLTVAYFSLKDTAKGNQTLSELEAFEKATDKPAGLDNMLREAHGYRELATNHFKSAENYFEAMSFFPKERMAGIYLRIGNFAKAEELAKTAVSGRTNEVQPLAVYIEALYASGKKKEASEQFKKLQEISEPIDADLPIFSRLASNAVDLCGSADWKLPYVPKTDVGKRPDLKTLGPFCWTPSVAPNFSLPDQDGHKVSLADFRKKGQPVLAIFYLGAGCRQCMEQLNLFAPVTAEFQKAGISLVAVSTDTVNGIKETLTTDPKAPKFPYPLLSDKDKRVFKAFRAYDDFEEMPLHGCYLIDKDGLIRWQDISFQPFKETTFLLEECKRLLNISGHPEADRSPGIAVSPETN